MLTFFFFYFSNGQKIHGRLWCEQAIKVSKFVNERFEFTLNKLWKELQDLN